VADSLEFGNEGSNSVKDREFMNRLSDYQIQGLYYIRTYKDKIIL
jgi:hypothetical protein